jgi:hypothetical protein
MILKDASMSDFMIYIPSADCYREIFNTVGNEDYPKGTGRTTERHKKIRLEWNLFKQRLERLPVVDTRIFSNSIVELSNQAAADFLRNLEVFNNNNNNNNNKNHNNNNRARWKAC